jgi:hypothetical protein
MLWPFTVVMKQTRQAVRAIKQSIFLDVYVQCHDNIYPFLTSFQNDQFAITPMTTIVLKVVF